MKLTNCYMTTQGLDVQHQYVDRTARGSIGADFRFEVPGQSSVGLIGGGRGQWLGGYHGECGARAYNGGLGAEPLVRGAKPSLKLKAFWSLDVQQSRQI